jgi:hypothetical protein
VVWVVYSFAVVAQQVEFEVTQVWSTSMDSVVGALELAAIALIWFVFFPPAVYQRWINRAAPTAMVKES